MVPKSYVSVSFSIIPSERENLEKEKKFSKRTYWLGRTITARLKIYNRSNGFRYASAFGILSSR